MTCIIIALKLLNLAPKYKLSIQFFSIVTEIICINSALKLLSLPHFAHKFGIPFLQHIFTVIICLNSALKLLVLPPSAHRKAYLFLYFHIFHRNYLRMSLPAMTYINIALKLFNLPPAYKLKTIFLYFHRNYFIYSALKLLNLPPSGHELGIPVICIFKEII